MAEEAREEWFPAAAPEKNVYGRFGYADILDIVASKAKDEKIYKKTVVLFTRVAGDADVPGPIKVHPDNKHDLIRRFPDAWRAFEGEAVNAGGTPLDALELPREKIAELFLFGVSRMEALADLSDQQCESMGFGTRALRSKARAILGREPIVVGSQPPAPQPAQPMVPMSDVEKLVQVAVAAALAAQKPVVVMPVGNNDAHDQALADGINASLKRDVPPKRRGRPPKAKPEASAEPAAA